MRVGGFAISHNTIRVAVSSDVTVCTFGNNKIHGDGTNVSGALVAIALKCPQRLRGDDLSRQAQSALAASTRLSEPTPKNA